MGVRCCSHSGCPAVVHISEDYCDIHLDEHADDGKPRPWKKYRGRKQPVGLSGRSAQDNKRRRKAMLDAMTPEDRETFLQKERKEKEKKLARRAELRAQRLAAQPKSGSSSGGGGNPTTDPNSKKAIKARRKERSKRKSRKG